LHENAAARLETEEADKDFPGKNLTVLLRGQLKDTSLEFAQTLVFYKPKISHCLIAMNPPPPQRRALTYGRGLGYSFLACLFAMLPP
jgi:hypothetical protein